jgi:hypothetical protein
MAADGSSPFPAGEPINVPPPIRRRGRPRGTDYRRVDRPLHEEMRRMLEQCEVPSKRAAANSVVDKAYGQGTRDSKITRLVRTYPF